MVNLKNKVGKKVSIIVPVYNSSELVKVNLPKIIEISNFAKANILEIIVVDDSSSDDTYKTLKTKFKSIKIIRHSIRRGFSSAVNTGARSSKGDLLTVLNIRVIPNKNFLVKALKDFENQNIFAISLHLNEKSWQSFSFKSGFVRFDDGKNTNKTHETSWVNSDNAIYRRDYWMKLGGLDEQTFDSSLWQDVDLSYRALKRGFSNIWEPSSHVFSIQNSPLSLTAGSKYKTKIENRDSILFIWKNITSTSMFRKHILGLLSKIASNPSYVPTVLSALKKFRQVYRMRQKEKKESKFSDEAVFAKFQDYV